MQFLDKHMTLKNLKLKFFTHFYGFGCENTRINKSKGVAYDAGIRIDDKLVQINATRVDKTCNSSRIDHLKSDLDFFPSVLKFIGFLIGFLSGNWYS